MKDALRNSAIEFRLAERLREHRKEIGISQKDLSEKIGIFQPNLWAWENEVTRPSTVSLWIKWCKAVGLDYIEELDQAIKGRESEE